MFPVYLVKSGLWPLLCVGEEALGYFLTCMELYGMDTSLVILFPQITMTMSSRGNIWVGVLMYPVAIAVWTAPFAVVSHTQLSY
jgi:hypothetical protein